jgi:hypothetical protein
VHHLPCPIVLPKQNGADKIRAMNTVLRILPAALAVLCLIAFIPWTLGIPGTQNDYARGWTIGYFAICWYLLAFAVLRALDLLAKYSKLPISRRLIHILGLVAVAGFIIAQIVAWPLILS